MYSFFAAGEVLPELGTNRMFTKRFWSDGKDEPFTSPYAYLLLRNKQRNDPSSTLGGAPTIEKALISPGLRTRPTESQRCLEN